MRPRHERGFVVTCQRQAITEGRSVRTSMARMRGLVWKLVIPAACLAATGRYIQGVDERKHTHRPDRIRQARLMDGQINEIYVVQQEIGSHLPRF